MEALRELVAPSVAVALVVGGALLLLRYVLEVVRRDDDRAGRCTNAEESSSGREQQRRENVPSKKKKIADGRFLRSDKRDFTDKWLKASLRGHRGQVLDMDYSNNGKYLATCSDDRTILLWDVKDLTQKDRKSLRVNLNDYATYIKWSPDNKAFLVTKYSENAIEVYKIVKKTDAWLSQPSKGLTVTKTHEDSVIVGLDIAANGKFVMTCSRDNQLLIWSLNLEVVTKIDTYLMYTNRARISPCGRFIAACGFAPDVKVWEVVFNKQKELQEVPRVFELCGHTSEVYDVDFDADTSHIASVSKDGTWKVFDTKVEYKKGEDPRLKTSGKLCGQSEPSKIAFSPDSEVVVIGTASSLHFYSVRTGNLDRTIDNVFDGTPITCMKFDPMGKVLFASGNKYVRIFNNVTGLKCAIENAKRKLGENQTSATKERLRKQIEDNEREIEEIDGK